MPESTQRRFGKMAVLTEVRSDITAEDFLAGLAIVGAMAADAEKEGRFIPAQEILKGNQKSKTDN